jgi:hypothetical protein
MDRRNLEPGHRLLQNYARLRFLLRRALLPATAGVVYRDVSEAFWKAGDRARAKAVIEQGRLAGGDTWLAGSSAGQALLQERANERARKAADEAKPTP